MKTNNILFLEDYLDQLFPNPKCELDYQKDYELLIAVVLSAQTTDKRVNLVTKVLFSKYPTLLDLSKADINDVMDIIRPIGTFNKKAHFILDISRILLDNYDGKVPNDPKLLQLLPGVGRKTANVVLSNLFDYPAIAVDTHVERVSKRLKLAKKDDSVLDVEKKLEKVFKKENWCKRHHQMVLFGRYHCKAISPECENCKLKEFCNYNKKK
ncbi:MAG: endonuclease III [Firmicutes bacterium]|nr:endonuclease III [Bacillota bacterium]